MGLMKAVGRSIEGIGNKKGLLAGAAAVAFGAGIMNKVSPAARDAAMDVAFDDPNADVSFLGRKFSGTYLLGRGMGGMAGTAASIANPIDTMYAQAPGVSPGSAGSGMKFGGTVGFLGGALAGYKSMELFNRGKLLKGTGGAVGAIAGLAIGASLGGFGPTAAHIRSNKKFFSESPYAPGGTSSLAMADALNASGDIVLGMHNSRRGY